MPRRSKPTPEQLLGSLEARVMEDLWKHGDSTVGETLDRLNKGRRRRWAYNSIMSVMARLEQKGLLEREREGRAYRYRPSMDREEFLRNEAVQAVRDVREEFGQQLWLAGFVDEVATDPSLRDELTRLLKEHGKS